MNDFHRDNGWQRGIRDRILVPHFYAKRAVEGRYVLMDKGRLAGLIQKRYAADTVLQSRHNEAVFIEEKIVRWPKRNEPYTAFSIETMSCTVPGRESDGWIKYGMADYLLYARTNEAEDAVECDLIDFPEFQAWFMQQDWNRWSRFVTDQINRSETRIVPFSDVRANAKTWQFSLPGPVEPVPIRETKSKSAANISFDATPLGSWRTQP